MKLEVCYKDKHLIKLEKTDKGDCIDIRVSSATVNGATANSVEYKCGDTVIVNFGIVCRVPANKRISMYARSSTFEKYGLILTNGEGVIDNSYQGFSDSLRGKFYAFRDGLIQHNDRIAQIEIVDRMDLHHDDIIEINEDDLREISRGGYGSSGHK